MTRSGIRIFAYIAIVLMLASVIPAVAFADSDEGLEEDDDGASGAEIQQRDRARANADENAPRAAEMNKIKTEQNLQARYAQAKKDFQDIKARNKDLDSEEAINATKEYLNSTIDWMIKNLDDKDLDDKDYIAALIAEKDEIAAASTRNELAGSARDIRAIWNDARKDKVVTSARAVNNKLNAVIKTSENMALRLQNEIDRLDENGEDVTGLQAMLDDYNAHINEAKQYQEQARNAYANGNGNDDITGNMNQAGQSIKDANDVLKKMLQALKQHREGLVVLTGEGTLEADGNGTAVISGNFSLDFNATDAMLVIKDMAGDASISTSDASYDSSNVDSGNSDDNNRAFVYHDLTGNVTINGTRLTIMLRGTDMDLVVEGKGTAMLSGDGTYIVNGVEEKAWATPDQDDDEDDEADDDTSDNEADDDASDNEADDDASDNEADDDASDDEAGDDEASGTET
ncbi:MAG: hypothetical protein JW705_06785 [Methanosarcinaceae archaeon]|nr:hypothetical protein [Methanosarcinaceae archaeon]